MSHSNRIYLEAIQILRGLLYDLLPFEVATRLERNLNGLDKSLPNDNDFIDDALDLIEDSYPQGHQELQNIVENLKKEWEAKYGREFSPFAYHGVNPLPDGIIMVCPISACRNRVEVFNVVERPHCERHRKRMIPWSEKYGR